MPSCCAPTPKKARPLRSLALAAGLAAVMGLPFGLRACGVAVAAPTSAPAPR